MHKLDSADRATMNTAERRKRLLTWLRNFEVEHASTTNIAVRAEAFGEELYSEPMTRSGQGICRRDLEALETAGEVEKQRTGHIFVWTIR